jgi:hypothetical protein
VSGDPKRGYQTLSARERARLASILSRLASSFAGERAAAGLLATAFLAKHDLRWTDLIDELRPISQVRVDPVDPPAKRDRRGPGNRGWRGYCRRRLIGRGGALDLAA